jgi:5-formyltetrahydrofolate cyclo-ligase
MTKEALRKIYREKRSGLPAGERKKMNDFIVAHFQKIPLPFINCVHTYIASGKLSEPDTDSMIRILQFKNPHLKILVPKIDIETGTMIHLHFEEEVEWVRNQFGIDEPASGIPHDPLLIDLVLVPLLAFDKRGFRVGFGKGYYDRFLSQCRKDVIKIGISYFPPVDEIEDIGQFDISLNYAVTPQQVFEF